MPKKKHLHVHCQKNSTGSLKSSTVCLRVFPTMQPWFTKAIDGKTAKGLLFSGVLVLSTDLKVANVNNLSCHNCQQCSNCESPKWKIIMIFTEHPFEASKFTLTPLVHFDFLGLQLGTTLGERLWFISEHFIQMAMPTIFQFVFAIKKEILHLCHRTAVVHECSGHLALVFHLGTNI